MRIQVSILWSSVLLRKGAFAGRQYAILDTIRALKAVDSLPLDNPHEVPDNRLMTESLAARDLRRREMCSNAKV